MSASLNAALLLLLDSRAPAGGHAHSSGMEPAVTAGLVRDLADVETFCRGRLRTAGRVAAAFAAASCAATPDWPALDAEYDARLPSEALRTASRQLGGGLRRMLASMYPDAALPWAGRPHHPMALGHGVRLAGGTPAQAATAAAVSAVSSPAGAAVRLLGLDPLAVQSMLARITAEFGPELATGRDPRDLPADGAPYLDLLADVHHTAEVRLFAS
jgi:urease accessory protein